MPNIGFWATAGAGGAAGVPAYELISTTVLSAFATSVTFSSIPSTYKHIQVRATVGNLFTNNSMRLQMNGDTAANYNGHKLWGNGASVQSSSNLGNGYFLCGDVAGDTSTFAPNIVDILDYASTSKFKTARAFSGFYNGYQVALYSGTWRSTAAVTSLTFTDNGAYGFEVGSRFSIYGLKG